MKGAGGGKRRSRKPARVEPDDRPRGFETRRMQQVWRDIDQARHKAGLGRTPDEPTTPPPWWEIADVLGRANAIAGDAVAWLTPAACALLVTGSAILRQLPVVGRLADLVPLPDGGLRPSTRPSDGNGGDSASVATVVEPAGGEPNGHWTD